MWSFGILTIKVCFVNREWLQNEKKWITKTKSNKKYKENSKLTYQIKKKINKICEFSNA